MWHIEVPRLGIESELQPLAYATAIAMWDLSCICNLYHSPQHLILNPLSKTTDRTCILIDASQICFHWATIGALWIIWIQFLKFELWFFSGYMPRSGIAGSYSSSIFSFLRNLFFSSIVVVPIYIPTNCLGGFPFLYTLSREILHVMSSDPSVFCGR